MTERIRVDSSFFSRATLPPFTVDRAASGPGRTSCSLADRHALSCAGFCMSAQLADLQRDRRSEPGVRCPLIESRTAREQPSWACRRNKRPLRTPVNASTATIVSLPAAAGSKSPPTWRLCDTPDDAWRIVVFATIACFAAAPLSESGGKRTARAAQLAQGKGVLDKR